MRAHAHLQVVFTGVCIRALIEPDSGGGQGHLQRSQGCLDSKFDRDLGQLNGVMQVLPLHDSLARELSSELAQSSAAFCLEMAGEGWVLGASWVAWPEWVGV